MFEVRPIGVVVSPSRGRVDAIEALDGTPVVDLEPDLGSARMTS